MAIAESAGARTAAESAASMHGSTQGGGGCPDFVMVHEPNNFTVHDPDVHDPDDELDVDVDCTDPPCDFFDPDILITPPPTDAPTKNPTYHPADCRAHQACVDTFGDIASLCCPNSRGTFYSCCGNTESENAMLR